MRKMCCMRNSFASVLLALLLAASARAICLHPAPRLLCAEYSQSDAVVTARLLRTRQVTLSNDDDVLLLTMQTEKVLRGKMRSVFTVVDSPYTGRALVPKKGQRYLLFLSYSKNYKAWALDSCGNSGPLEESAEVLKGIDQMKEQTGGTIQGVVWPDPGATILVHGSQHTFKTTTDDKGEFKVQVPAGAYSVSVNHDGKRFEPDPLSYEDPKRLRIYDGGCAQVQFNVIEGK